MQLDATPSGAWRTEVSKILDDAQWLDRLVAIAGETIAATPGWTPGSYDDATLRESVRGFVAVLKESLDGTSDDMRRLFMETAIPAYVAAGQSPESLVTGAATYQVLVATALVAAMPESARRDTLKWFAGFAGAYVSDLCASATRSAR